MSLLFIRHGESTANRDKIYAGHLPVSLTEKGKQQAKQTAKILKDKNITYIISSDLPRAYQTAEIILDTLDDTSLTIHTTQLLREVDAGENTGKPYKKGQSIYDISISSNGGESNEDLYIRGSEFLNFIKNIDTHGDILVVGHNSFTSIIWSILDGEKDFKKYRNGWYMENADIKEYPGI